MMGGSVANICLTHAKGRHRFGARVCLAAFSLVLLGVLAAAQMPAHGGQQQRPRRAVTAPTAPDAGAGTTARAGEEVGEDEVVRVDTQLIPVTRSQDATTGQQ